ncbi:nucleotidyl transferase AbiEii/AbiGii toxin family protein [Leeuwenhoekiella palythoae]|uniref:Nucleotidyl transferase AbiEii toxin, Type IV TA system n=1 Tax=Leeuwenhoekiella palythoae TaxID=573501 RepID=A0A1M5YW68_9FLAO|nr:nucleotidyl transferase AbiEii/AbiGii toxin family protein [Leeuwenhoekiella palythoae]RXG29581.1 nucleotidyltransferase AbiEii toxin of type IV toxin-antitoxin system [Leeuwenhoekiella palythoae]SHI16060.1 Nucleotidyl transferase AbiEii toxin, Type IV TA system [Leeuwenhoekiella palythoae]
MELQLNTVSELLWNTLQKLMEIQELHSFRLVGGTSLSLQRGHRESIDIDLFSDAPYGSIDFEKIESILRVTFPYFSSSSELVGIGKSYFIGNTEDDLVKLDLFYTDPFVFPLIMEQKVRFASVQEIAAMKLEVVGQGGRKKDFWDIHELLESYTLNELIGFYLKRYPYNLSTEELMNKIVDFSLAEDDFTPNCYRGKIWELIKLDLEELVER